jgi:FHA domain-containing protein
MVYSQIYLGHLPATLPERQMLRERALDLHDCLRTAHSSTPTYVLLNFAAGDTPLVRPVELLLLRPNAAIVGAIRSYQGPIDVTPAGPWMQRDTGAPIVEAQGRTPLQVVRDQRDAVRARLNHEAAGLLGVPADAQPFERTVGALICAPQMHPESHISLDVGEHRQWLKILGLDELPGLAAMIRIGTQLAEETIRQIVSEVFGGRLWHDGERLLFELAPGRFQLRLLAEGDRAEEVLPLIVGENVIGRRRQASGHEHRLTLTGDDLISSDHALLICQDNDRVTLRDTSKNGTWIASAGGPEEHLHGAERTIGPGTLLRMGVTRMRLECVDE